MIIRFLIEHLPYLSGLRVLMYHRVDRVHTNFLTVKESDLDSQIRFLKNEQFHFLKLSELHALMESGKAIPSKSLLLTFDDAYLNNHELLLPILEQHRVPATIFLPVGFIGKKNEWDGSGDDLISYEKLKSMGPWIEFGIHSYSHQSYAKLSLAEIEHDLQKCFTALHENNIPYEPSLAYPFGAFPRGEAKRRLDELFSKMGIKTAFRIGNQVNRKINPYEINRIDIRGDESFDKFRLKMKLGKIKL